MAPSKKKQMLDFKEGDYPKAFTEVIRLLQKGISEPDVQKLMNIKDEPLKDLLGLALNDGVFTTNTDRFIVRTYKSIQSSS
jgi:Ran GTPase-activating protein (RanGAP) involved in mRNA processing and transport